MGVDSLDTVDNENEQANQFDGDQQHILSDWQKQKLKECVTLFKEVVPGKIGHTNAMTYTVIRDDLIPAIAHE
jgi:hypothetical protein